ncbi:dna-binding horma domain-containing protein [Plasmopara halstedii]|uniref:Dna-binding horma domain-containing protein n=1 Tax=Plasmopara halstedii TaxID=4781 RepID=A0A0P1B591_PLAHL|nr:dna-binding horma domain-containing protein [Plasmopara halstedii]CEG49332.1 dna-binding horma domain-containing protein [Plasmopara halstedii]|eukprot:XP_024585701.1 dna-binding horma domain-containing protein [Plasmopara halstedii]
MATAQISENLITLKGSTEIVTEFFSYSINTILYQRGIYPAESFKQVQKYGLNMLVTDDDKLNDFFSKFLHQLSNWLLKGEAKKLVLVITGIDTQEVLERWAFEVYTDDSTDESSEPVSKPQKEIMAEIQAIIRQITASVSFLPILEEQCAFDLLVYTDKDSDVPALWEESDPRFIKDSAEVRLRSFTTKLHKVDAMVAYKNPEADI